MCPPLTHDKQNQLNHVYVFVRKDLPAEQIVVQTAHAGIELTRQGLIPSHYDHPHLVVIGIDHEEKLRSIFSKIEQNGVRCIPFIEPDFDNEMTAFATEPILEDRRHLFRRFNCLRLPQVQNV